MRLRVRFQKLGKVRFTSHRDVARMWERACRRVRLPLAWTGGFSPRPKISFGLALPTAHESLAEYLDLDLVQGAEVDVTVLPAAFSAALPGGVDATAVAVREERALSLQEEVVACHQFCRHQVFGQRNGDRRGCRVAIPIQIDEQLFWRQFQTFLHSLENPQVRLMRDDGSDLRNR